jgi:hypothetical protein
VQLQSVVENEAKNSFCSYENQLIYLIVSKSLNYVNLLKISKRSDSFAKQDIATCLIKNEYENII